VCDQHADIVTFDETADLDWPYITGAVVFNDDQIWWEKVRLRDERASDSSENE
jgi:hypothetical protein